jgi:hypothetical protein
MHMWDQLTPDDIAQVKHRLSLRRAETLSRHAAELQTLDAQQEEIETFALLVSQFADKYLTAEKSAFQPTGTHQQRSAEARVNEEQSADAREIEAELILRRDGFATIEVSAPAATEVPREKPSPDLHVQYNSGMPLRRFVGR